MSIDDSFSRVHELTGSRAELMGLLVQQERVCAALLEVSAREREAVLGSKVDILEQVGLEKGRLVEELGELDARRQEASTRVASELGLPATASLVDLASRMGGPDAINLRAVRERILDLAGRLSESNDGNLQSIRRSLELVRGSIRQLRRMMGSGSYSPSGSLVLDGSSLAASIAVDRQV
jgi:hypothetical protein